MKLYLSKMHAQTCLAFAEIGTESQLRQGIAGTYVIFNFDLFIDLKMVI